MRKNVIAVVSSFDPFTSDHERMIKIALNFHHREKIFVFIDSDQDCKLPVSERIDKITKTKQAWCAKNTEYPQEFWVIDFAENKALGDYMDSNKVDLVYSKQDSLGIQIYLWPRKRNKP